MSILRPCTPFATCAALCTLALAATAVADDAPPGWAGKVSLGGSISRGTTDSLSGNLEATAERSWDDHLLRLGLRAAYGRTDPDGGHNARTDNDEQYLTQYYRYTASKRLYLFGDFEQSRDAVQDIDFRLIANAGPGYRIWEGGEKRYLDVEGGIGYRHESRSGDANLDNVLGRTAATFSTSIDAATFVQTAEFLLPFDSTGEWLARARTSLAFPLTQSWSFENSLNLEYQNDPAGDPPNENANLELDYIVSLVYSF